jgi:hypothetical protein
MVYWYDVCTCMIVVLCFSFAMLDPTIDAFEEEEYFEDFEDNQGQATQGKPPLLATYLDPSFYLCKYLHFILFQRYIVSCNCYYLLIAIRWRLGSTSHLISSLR